MTPRRIPRVLAIATAAVLALTTAACGGGAGSAGGDNPRLLLFGHGADPGNPRSDAADAFAEQVSAAPECGDVQAQGAEQLGSDREMLQSVRAGTLHITANSQGPLAGFVPEVALIGLPFLFEDAEQAYEVLDGEVGAELASRAEAQRFKVLAWWDNGIRHVTNNQRPIETPEDLSGLKIRTPEDPMTVDIFSALNANPTPIAFGELYLALRQGTVDGQENPLTNIAAAKLNEVQDHLALTGHQYQATPLLMNLDTFNGLTPDCQRVIQQAAEDARDSQRAQMQEQMAELQETLGQEMEITEVDKAAFREATRSVYDKWSADHPELVESLTTVTGV